MKFVEGLQLRTLLDCLALTPPSEPAIAHVALTLAEALEALSRSEEGPLVHGDLSASNVMAHRDGTLTLLDLGSAARSGDPSLDGGTPRYAPPERQRGTPLTEAGDIYSLGVLLWELAVGRRWPTEAPRHLPETSPTRGTAMGALISQCIASDSGRRPRDAAAIRQVAATRITADGQEAWRQWSAATMGMSKLDPAAHSAQWEGRRAWLGLGATVSLAIWTASWFIAQMI
jgi:serine/threonine protein kinase